MRSIFVCSLILAVLAFCVQSAQADVIINITGAPTDTSATVSVNGSLTLLDAVTSGISQFVVVPIGGFNDLFGNNPNSGRPTTSPFAGNQGDVNTDEGAGIDTATFSIFDTTGGVNLTSGSIRNMRYTTPGGFDFVLDGSESFPSSIDTGDVLSFSGSFDLDFGNGDMFSDRFVSGTHVGTYNGQNVTVNVSDASSVPEPGSLLLVGVGIAGVIAFRQSQRRSVASGKE